MREIEVRDLGLTDYRPVLALQRELQSATAGERSGVLLVTEHRPVFTLGRSHPLADLRVSADDVAARGIEIVQTERGGDITYHGPGQLVAYPIINLRAWELPLLDFVAGLEACAMHVLDRFGVAAESRPQARGVWTGGRKIASLGVNVRRWVTMHGIALNVDLDMSDFALINACGMADVEMTSMAGELGSAPSMAEVKAVFVDAFSEVFSCRVVRVKSVAAPPVGPGTIV